MDQAVDDLKVGDAITLPHRQGRCIVKQVLVERTGVKLTYAHRGRRYTENFSRRDRVALAEQSAPALRSRRQTGYTF
jgi:hypothetical protein